MREDHLRENHLTHKNHRDLTLADAEKIVEVTSSIFQQGGKWVFREWDLDAGVEKLTRCISEKSAKQKLKQWRKERIEVLLRQNQYTPVYTIKVWQENPSWKGEGVWHWAKKHWYVSEEDALKEVQTLSEKIQASAPDTISRFAVFPIQAKEIPSSFTLICRE